MEMVHAPGASRSIPGSVNICGTHESSRGVRHVQGDDLEAEGDPPLDVVVTATAAIQLIAIPKAFAAKHPVIVGRAPTGRVDISITPRLWSVKCASPDWSLVGT